MVAENLVINPDDPLSMYWPPDNKLGEAHSGRRYHDLYEQLITDPKRQLLVPIIMYLDGTPIDSKGHIDVCPVSITTSLFTEKARRDHKFWKVLGYAPDLMRKRSKAMNARRSLKSSGFEKGSTTRNFHKVMDVILNGMAKANKGDEPRLLGVPVKLGTKWVKVDIICPLLFVINDGKQGDQICGRFVGHSEHTVRHHRSCDCVYDDLDNPDVACSFLDAAEIKELCMVGSAAELKALSMYRHDNAFSRLQMGNNPSGIFFCAAPDVMHSLQHGVFMYALENFMQPLGCHVTNQLDRLALWFDRTVRQSCRANFPRADFARGVTNLTKIECSERSGALFLIAILLFHEDGRDAVVTKHTQDALQDIFNVISLLLFFEAWLGQEKYWDLIDEDEPKRALQAIKFLINRLVIALPRTKGNNWKISKLHEMLHLVMFMIHLGSTSGYNASRPEAHHIPHSKNPARRSQQDAQNIDQQCAKRITDTLIMETVDNILNPPPVHQPPEAVAAEDNQNATRFEVKAFLIDGQYCRSVDFITKTRAGMVLLPNLDIFLLQHYADRLNANGIGAIQGCTEYRRLDPNAAGVSMITFRCHPNYRGCGPWYDWAIIRFEEHDNTTSDYPSRIVCAVPPLNEAGAEFELVVQCCTFRTNRIDPLFTEWHVGTDFHVVPSDSIVARCLAVPSCGDESRVMVVTPQCDWAGLFYTSAEAHPNVV